MQGESVQEGLLPCGVSVYVMLLDSLALHSAFSTLARPLGHSLAAINGVPATKCPVCISIQQEF